MSYEETVEESHSEENTVADSETQDQREEGYIATPQSTVARRARHAAEGYLDRGVFNKFKVVDDDFDEEDMIYQPE